MTDTLTPKVEEMCNGHVSNGEPASRGKQGHSHPALTPPLVFRFEPFILALEVATSAASRAVLRAARVAGFRESGVMLGKRLVVGIRTSLRLEVPLTDELGVLAVNKQYVDMLVR